MVKGKKGLGGRDWQMRICSFFLKGERQDRLRAGVVADSRVHEIGGGPTVSALLLSGSGLRCHEGGGPGHPLESVVLGAPLPRPGKIIAAIVNTHRMLGGEDV